VTPPPVRAVVVLFEVTPPPPVGAVGAVVVFKVTPPPVGAVVVLLREASICDGTGGDETVAIELSECNLTSLLCNVGVIISAVNGIVIAVVVVVVVVVVASNGSLCDVTLTVATVIAAVPIFA